MVSMKRFAILLSGLAGVLFAQPKPQPSQVRAVYLLPMMHGLDQHLANQLTSRGVYVVVADPKKADAVFTDHLGQGFESELDDLVPLPEPAPTPAPPKPEAKDKDSKANTKDKDAEAEEKAPNLDMKQANDRHYSSFGRTRGTLFLVDARTRTVLWSIYEKPKDSSSQELEKTAERVVVRLRKDLTKK